MGVTTRYYLECDECFDEVCIDYTGEADQLGIQSLVRSYALGWSYSTYDIAKCPNCIAKESTGQPDNEDGQMSTP